MGTTRSAAAAEASRRNGARSKGPSSADGKAKSARNSVKFGLFSRSADMQVQSEAARLLAEEVASADDTAASHYLMSALDAWGRLDQVILLLDRLNADLNLALAAGGGDYEALVQEIVRMGRYERRFRGQRDRAMRAALGVGDA